MTGHRDDPAAPKRSRDAKAVGSEGSLGNGKAADNFSNKQALERAIRDHVVPSVGASEAAHQIPDLDAPTLFKYVVDGDEGQLKKVVPLLLKHNVTFEDFHDALLQPVFELMQEGWHSDKLDFLTVDLATARMQMICNALVHHRLKLRKDGSDTGPTVLIAQCSDDAHTMGLSVVRAFFTDAGWDVDGGAHVSPRAGLFETLGTSDYDLLALSSGRENKEAVASVIERVRQVSMNSGLTICLGGPSVRDELGQFDRVGADVVVGSASEAVAGAQTIMQAH
ncbi:MAG: cobalamin-dependent protein [Pseudomonadota bacterium]